MGRIASWSVAMITCLTLVASGQPHRSPLLETSAGILLGQLGHEAGHDLTCRVLGVPAVYTWKSIVPLQGRFGTYRWKNDLGPVDRKYSVAAMGGFAAEILQSEVVFLTADVKHDRIAQGIILQSIISPVCYLIRDALTPGGYGDFRQIAYGHHNVRIVKWVVGVHAAINLIRLMQTLHK